MLENLSIYLFITIWISCLWSLGDIFMPIRNLIAKYLKGPLSKMLLCMECSSFWIGFFTGFIYKPFNLLVFNDILFNSIILAIFGGIITHLFVKVLNKHNIL